MNIEFVGKGIDISEDLKSYAEHKLSSFKSHLKEVGEGDVEVIVTFNIEKHRERHRVDIDVYLKTPGGGALHAWEESKDTYMSLEFAIDDIEKQLNRLKERRIEQRKEVAREKAKSLEEEFKSSPGDLITEERLPIAKPLTVDEALMVLQDQGRFFLVFRNADTGDIGVIYRKKSGKYGLVSP
ncbi:ribosome-associated translation inhibitor RaiA [Desulfobacterota bacterium AH_259_B03_O07]|nr:ribosome-associated translation inhibitor RaiA [Desulfobacterota bacterium AH_259_B03_O07]